jgi:hypothetical protein
MAPTIASYKELRGHGLDRAISDAYADQIAARALLMRIDYPPSRIPQFHDADSFWTETFGRIEQGVLHAPTPAAGFESLLRQCALDYPGNPPFKPWRSPANGVALTTPDPQAAPVPPPDAALRPVRFDCFLSYNSRDFDAVEAIARRLTERGVIPWLDRWHLPAGQIVDDVLREVLRNTPAIAVFVGPENLGPWQTIEVRHAITDAVRERATEPLIPVLLPGGKQHVADLPLGLRDRNWVEFRDIDDPDALNRLVRGIENRPPATR